MTSQTKCFVSFGEMNPFVFAVLAASASETKRTIARWARAGLGVSRTKALEAGATGRPRPEERCAASHLEGWSKATNTFVAALEHSLRQAQGRLSRPPCGASERGLVSSKALKNCVEAH